MGKKVLNTNSYPDQKGIKKFTKGDMQMAVYLQKQGKFLRNFDGPVSFDPSPESENNAMIYAKNELLWVKISGRFEKNFRTHNTLNKTLKINSSFQFLNKKGENIQFKLLKS